jgi:PadR family transcriptional regulator, regulatory protein PadR
MAGDVRMTKATAFVLQALDAGLRHGFDIAAATGLRGGSVYPILRRLERAGLVEGRWEDPAVGRAEGRPGRRYYRLRGSAAGLLEEAVRRHPLGLDEGGPEVAR